MANRVILGEFNGDYVLRVSRPGHNVLNTALARKNLAFDSRWPETLQVVNQGRVFQPAAGTIQSISHGGIAHATGSVVLMWVEYNGYLTKLDGSWGANAGHSSFRAWTTNSTIQFRRQNNGSNHPDVWLQFITLRQSNG